MRRLVVRRQHVVPQRPRASHDGERPPVELHEPAHLQERRDGGAHADGRVGVCGGGVCGGLVALVVRLEGREGALLLRVRLRQLAAPRAKLCIRRHPLERALVAATVEGIALGVLLGYRRDEPSEKLRVGAAAAAHARLDAHEQRRSVRRVAQEGGDPRLRLRVVGTCKVGLERQVWPRRLRFTGRRLARAALCAEPRSSLGARFGVGGRRAESLRSRRQETFRVRHAVEDAAPSRADA
mmetsp:Transcript_26651/g.62196  ORF Transcript_26651/g.62196 Transcript_26651/m.62196 type:complete len:239 (-) Transcript_26651:988-1704(-)